MRRWKRLSTRRKWLLAAGLAALTCLAALVIAAIIVGRKFEPFVRDQAIRYLERRFESKVELAALRVHVPKLGVWKLLRSGPEEFVTVEGEGLVIRHKGRTDIPPLFSLKEFSALVNLKTLFDAHKRVPMVTLEGMEITVPPKGQRPNLTRDEPSTAAEETPATDYGVIIEHVDIRDAKLTVLSRDPSKVPLHFDLSRIDLRSAGKNAPMKYEATLTNPRPPGDIRSAGNFGPWSAAEPSETPLAGSYIFENADLGVFHGIAGTLQSTGQFQGRLGAITARGVASVPDFRLKRSGTPVRLHTEFEVLVDGTNGNTTLKPVHARLGKSNFTTSGTIIKHEGDRRKTISLHASMPSGDMRDILTLAMKGGPFMEGTIKLDTKIDIPPLSGKVKEKLQLDGAFEVTEGKFLKSTIQDQVDTLSRRGQGKPKSQEIDEVVSRMSGDFILQDEVITFKTLAFEVAGAAVNISGNYNLDGDLLDFRGALMLKARLSQTQSGWKRWVLKPVDPFFSKNGAGTFLKIKVAGSSKEPKFGLDR
jgi:hypothetical protein